MPLDFEWDRNKANENTRKHGVGFEEAISVFRDPLSFMIPNPDHSVGEERFLTLVNSARGRIVMVSHTARGDRIGLICARVADSDERRDCEEGI